MNKNIFSVITLTLLLSACNNPSPPEPNDSETILSESILETEREISSDSFVDYLENHQNGSLYHMLNDIALNENADTTSDSDKDVTYMFPKDDNGNRILGTVMAYYKDTENTASNSKEFCEYFINNTLPELSFLSKKPEIYSSDGYFGMIFSFDDYSVTLMPDSDLSGMTVILSNSN